MQRKSTKTSLFQIIQDILKWTLAKEKSIQNIFRYSFVSIFRTQTDSEDVFIDFLWILYFTYGYFVDINDQKCYLDCKSTELVPVLSRVWRIYSNIRIFLAEYLIFEYEYLKIGIRIYSNIRTNEKLGCEYIRIFVNFSQ